MNSSENDDYWNESKISTFNFERDEGKSENVWSLDDRTYASSNISSDSTIFPSTSFDQSAENEIVKNYLSQTCIDSIIKDLSEHDDDLQFERKINADEDLRRLRKTFKDRWSAPDPEETVNRIFLDQHYSLEMYRSYSDKKKLLNAAVKLGDGNAILSVVVYLARTLKKSLFRQLLLSNQIAISHYLYHLYTRRQMSELIDTLEVLGKPEDAMMKQLVVASQNPSRLQQRLNQILKNYHLEQWERQVLENFSKLVEWQIQIGHSDQILENVVGSSPMEFVKLISSHKLSLKLHGLVTKHDCASEVIAKSLGLSEKQLLVSLLNSNTENKGWDAVRNLLISKNWVGGVKLNTNLPMLKILENLRKCNAPPVLLDDILGCVADLDKRIELALKLDRSMVAIDAYNKQKDKSSLLKYAATLDLQSPERSYAEKILCKMAASVTYKWINSAHVGNVF